MKTLPKIIQTVKNAIQKNKIMKKMELHLATKRNTILLFCLTILFGTSCLRPEPAENHNVRWQGKVLEKSTNKVVPRAKIYLYEYGLGSDFGTIKPSVLIDTYEADTLGRFDFTYYNKVSNGYEIKVGAQKYYLSKGIGVKDNNGQSNTDVLLDPYAWIKFHVKNVNPFDENDRITIDRFHPLDGNRIDTFLISEQIGNLDHEVIKRITKGGIYEIRYDVIPFLKAHDTTYFEIKY